MMNHTEGMLHDKNNACIYHQAWLPDGAAKAVLLVVHGLGEHSGRYMNVVNHFVPLGYAVYALDHIGHGKSEGIREYVERFEDYTDTLTLFYNQVQGWQPGKPIFLLGHSMGGLISRYYIDRLMGDEGVGQLIMLGSPMAGSDCAKLPAALGY